MKSEQARSQSNDECEPLAIIGLAFEFPQTATSVEDFWELVYNGETTSSDFPTDRFNIDAFYHPDQDRPSTLPLRGGHFLKENLGAFDAAFFSITPSEAACMDPQHRHMLETAYHALEDAGIPMAECSGSNTAVYTGCFTNDYLSILHQDYEADQKHAAMGLVPSMMANRLSWFFNFKGTSMNLDSACSSSLVALHLACQDLRTGNSDMALVGGANLVYHPNFMKTMSDFNFLSPDSHCWSFDERANGYARGEGIAVIVVKRLGDALRDNNTIRAIIRNTGSNQDGKTPGITQPSGDAQVSLIKDTYRRGNIDMGPTRFFQAHATGTAVGDPIEGNAIGRAFKGYRKQSDPLHVGAIKSNIGHLEGCSGLAGIIVTILVLESGIIPPISSLEVVNKRIEAEKLHLNFPREPLPWPDSPIRRACVNSFGFGGTNAVAILDDAYSYMRLKGIQGYHRTHQTASLVGSPFSSTSTKCERRCQRFKATKSQAVEPIPAEKSSVQLHTTVEQSAGNVHRVLLLSAPDKQGAERLTDLYHVYLRTRPTDFKFDDLAYAMIINRSQFSWKSFAIASTNGCNPSELIEFSKPIKSLKSPRIAFIFTGQGAQYLGMGCELVSFSVFRDSLAACGEYLKILGCTWSPLTILDSKSAESDINSPEISQPLTTILQIALVDLLKSFGIVASVVIGHSSGEIAGAYASGALSKRSAVKVAYYRGLLSSQLASTRKDLSMMAAGLSRQEILPYFTRLEISEKELDVEIGCINSPNSITLTGSSHQLAIIESYLKADGVFTRMLRVPTAYHSRYMRSIAEKYATSIRDIEKEQASLENVSMISSVSGEVVKAQDLSTAQYWVLNLISSVEFEAAFTKLLTYSAKTPRRQLKRSPTSDFHSITHILEVGPHGALQGPIRDMTTAHPGVKPRYLATLARKEDASLSISKLVGCLHCAGFDVDLSSFNGPTTMSRAMPPDMPHYPFNHSQTHWIESSLSRNFRFRNTPRHDLLGTRAIDWNPQMAIWRNVMRLSELLWLEDHKIGGIVVLPAAAILTMAIEAYRQLQGLSRPFHGVYISSTTFSHAVSFSSGVTKIETQFSLTPSSCAVDLQPTSEFRLFLMENGSYIECAKGFLRGITEETDKEAVIAAGPWRPGDTWGTWIRNIEESCSKHTKSPYRVLAGTELQYGSSFQNLSGVTVGAHGQVSAVVATKTWKVEDIMWPPTPFMIHPATLDGIFQSSLHSHLAKQPYGLPTMMPVRVAGLFIDSCVSELSDDFIRISARPSTHLHTDNSSDIVGTGYHTGLPLLYVVGLETATISDVYSSRANITDKTRRLCTRLVWKADIDTMTQQAILQYCTHERPKQQLNAVAAYRLQKVAIMCFIEEALSFLYNNPGLKLEAHLESYVGWMRYQRDLLARSDPESSLLKASVQKLLADPSERQRVNSEVKCAPGDGFFFIEIGEHLIDILRGEVDPLDLMFRNGLADRYYEEMLGNEHHSYPVAQFLDLLCFKNPSMKILEVGAGTGGQTTRVLDAMNHNGMKNWEQYDYTDVSPGFFAAAKEKFGSHVGHMNFRVCDISKDSTGQGFEEHSYNLVIASHVLHATNSLRDSLRNVRRLLKPNGKFLLFETTRPEAIPIGFAFGILQGWWEPLRFEARSTHSPCVNVECWDTLLREAGFTGVDVNIPGQQEPYCQSASILLSTAVGDDFEILKPVPHVYIVMNDQVEAQVRVAAALRSSIQETMALASETRTLAELSNQKIAGPSLTIFLSEIDDVLIDEISSNNYETVQSVLVRAKNILWVTRTEPLSETRPKQQLSTGLGRSLMSEDSTRKFVHLDLTHSERVLEDEVHFIRELAGRILSLPVEDIDNDYVVLQNKLHICRLTEYAEMDEKIAQAISPRQNREIQLTHESRLELCSPQPNAGSVEWREVDRDEYHDASSDPEDVIRVQVQAVGLTFRDYLTVRGQLKATSLGNECAGVVIQSGSRSAFKPGDHVCFISSSSACSVVEVKARALIKIPPTLSLVSAASMCTAQWVAYYALVKLAHLQQGEIVLIHQGSSCVGQMAIQLARKFSCRVLVTVGSANRAKFLDDEFSIPEDDIFHIGDPMLLYRIRQSTKQQGVDVVIGAIQDSIKDYGPDMLACLGPCGRLVDTSLLVSATTVQNSISRGLSWNTSTSTIDMAGLVQQKPDLFYATFQSALRLAFDEHLKPPQSVRTFTPGEVNLAFDAFEKRAEICKRVITLDLHSTVPASIKTKSTYQFHEDATYIIGGGLGGIGRSVARWMVTRGARNLILPSRSGVSTDTSKLFVNELEQQGIRIATPKVNLADHQELESVLQGLTKVMPPIRGCIQCATVLRDNLFANMSYDDWCISVNSKAKGSWNLHSTLPNGLDFFIMLASVNGIFGGRAQANYAAANAFQDALAHYRVSLGEKATSIDLGLMVGEGIVAEDVELLGALRRWGQFMDVEQNELIALLDQYCNPELSLSHQEQAQIVIGVETAAAIRAKGIDIHHSFSRPLFRQLFRMDALEANGSHGAESRIDYATALRQASSDEAAGELITTWLKTKIAQTLNLQQIDVDEEKPIHVYGIDSLVAIDLKNWFTKEVGAEIQVFILLGNKPLREVAFEAAQCSKFR
ncbi:lovastatin nonaketide synthase [Xylaria curta]|nr:lovastatin nonaketide synthase [Xylaria curta]